ncbi:MAG: coagulation factor 5/8 type domain-containing protein, partial [Pseudomonadota bacterium]|nr:coagulation factor 5/8 type domain-containing protein [Pseudomonadota bacterium]
MKNAALLALALVSGASAQEVLLDDFADRGAWTISASDDVKAGLRSVDGPHGRALCIDFDFGKVTGYVSASRKLPIDYPARYEFSIGVRGDAPPNALQFKLVDASGENVWWAQRPDYRFAREWQTEVFRPRDIGFAWGPTADRQLRHSASAELVIASGSGAGKGSACFDHLLFRRLPDQRTADEPRDFGDVAVRWPPERSPSRYDIQFSQDGASWQTARHIEGARGDVQHHLFVGARAHAVRVLADTEPAAIELSDAGDANAFFTSIAGQAGRGRYPRAFVGEQSYWTVFGVDGAHVAALMSEDGVIEPVPGFGALEPFLVSDGRVLSWADATITHSLRDGDLPMPSTRWRAGDLELEVAAFGTGSPAAARAVVRYTVHNTGRRSRRVALALAWRPFQANPPTQFLSHPGGASRIETLAWDGRTLRVNDALRLQAIQAPSSVRIEPAAAGPVGDWLAESPPAQRTRSLRDPDGFASAVLRYDMTLGPGERREVDIALPLSPSSPLTPLDPGREEARVAARWRAALDKVRIDGPGEVDEVARTVRSSLGYILVNRSGPALQPGARAYARSWIRDGALTSSALLRLGHEDAAKDFLLWFAPFQFKNGKVPCCATGRGADPVPENDSDGEFIFAVADLWRYSHDDATARRLWPRVAAAVSHMESLRQSERTAANQTADRLAYFGLMPPSISHEGYSDKPAYSYWDDFWAYTGYRSAVELASGLGFDGEAARTARQRDEFLADLEASLATSSERFGLDVLPGSADRGDVDPTSSTVALSPAGLLGVLPETTVRNTFDRYWRDFQARRRDESSGLRHGDGAYTPYEWRNVGAFVRLGERERAMEALTYFYADRRPAGWNQWAEVVLRDLREPRFLGDMPHGWVASDHIRSVLDMFAYEREGDHSVVLAAGVPMSWLRGKGLSIHHLRTPYGRLTWTARAAPNGAVD